MILGVLNRVYYVCEATSEAIHFQSTLLLKSRGSPLHVPVCLRGHQLPGVVDILTAADVRGQNDITFGTNDEMFPVGSPCSEGSVGGDAGKCNQCSIAAVWSGSLTLLEYTYK